ncbi:MAG: hypothetical protein JWQ37_3577 [Blastococcus sp.]|nr:hypothetical protein [Blastococcus sp.]
MTRRLWPYLRILVGAGILVALVLRLGSDAVAEGLRAIDARAVLAALGIGLLTTVLSAWRWCLVAHGLGLSLPLRVAVADCYRALFLNSVLPVGVLGDVHRAVSHGRQAGDVGRGIRAVALERSASLLVSVIVGVAVVLSRPELLMAAIGPLVLGGWGAVGLVVVLAAVAALGVWTVRGAHPSRIRAALRTGAHARTGVFSRGTWPGVVLLSVATLVGYLALFVIAARAAGCRSPLGELLPLLVPGLLAMALPLSIGGWGPREAVATVAFGAGGLGATLGFTAALVYGVLCLIACLPGGALLLLRSSSQPVPARVGRSTGPSPGRADR